MAITIKSSNDLERLLDALSSDIIDSIHFWRLSTSIKAELKNYADVFTQSNTFWSYSLRSLHLCSRYALCRVFDTEDTSLSLPNLLRIISDNLQHFSEDHFRERLKDNPFVDSLAKSPRIPTPKQLQADIKACSPSSPIIQKLIVWRNNLYAHRGAKSTLKDFQCLSDNPLGDPEVKKLLDLAIKTYNRYLSLFKASTWSTMLIGEDDFLSLLRFAQSGLDQYRQNIKNETALYLDKAPPPHA